MWLPLPWQDRSRLSQMSPVRRAELTHAARRPTLKSMEVHLTPDLERKLKTLAVESGRAADEMVQDAVAGYVDEFTEMRAHIEEGFLQAERGDLLDAAEVRREVQARKDAWRQEHCPAR
ncbi:MAG: hypothetical protein ABJA98_23660 [Acidobacteriota bacterium]